MKTIKLLSLVLLFTGIATAAEKPKYTLKSPEIVGQYLMSDGEKSASVMKYKGRFLQRGETTVSLIVEDQKIETTLYAKKSGVLAFHWKNPAANECTKPGCWNLASVGGYVYAKKLKDGSYAPGIKSFIRKNYVPKNDEDTQEPETTDEEFYVKK